MVELITPPHGVTPHRVARPQGFAGKSKVWNSGVSVMELLVATAVFAVLAAISLTAVGGMRAKAEKANCMANLRSLHTALATHLTDRGHWPQCPPDYTQEQRDMFWLGALRTYGVGEKSWKCPSIVREDTKAGENAVRQSSLDYTATEFDPGRYTPYKWSRQPWLVEIGDMHKGGNLLIYPDGSIAAFGDIFPSKYR